MKNFYKILMLILIPMLLSMSITTIYVSKAATAELNIGILAPYYLPEGGGAARGYSGGFAADGGMIDGAIQAASEINNTGGIVVGGTTYYVNLIIRDEGAFDLSSGSYNTATTDASMQDLLGKTGVPGTPVSFIIGGFRTETTQEAIYDLSQYNSGVPVADQVPFFVCGSATIAAPGGGPGTPYLWDPTTEPYVYRLTPVNDTMLFYTVADYCRQYLMPKLAAMYGGTVKYCVISEQLTWTQAIDAALTNTTLLYGVPVYKYLLGMNASLLAAPNSLFQIPVDASTGYGTHYDFSSILSTLQGLHCHLILDFFTLPMAGNLVSQVTTTGTQAMLVGIDVPGQAQQWSAETVGTCNDEVLLAYSGTDTPIVPGYTHTFWTAFTGNNSGQWPNYCAAGAYDGLLGIKQDLQSGTPIPNTNRAGLTGQYVLTSNLPTGHDVYSDSTGIYWPPYDATTYGYARSECVQWIATPGSTAQGVMNTVSPLVLGSPTVNTSLTYGRKTQIPTSMYPLAPYDVNLDGKIDIKDVHLAAKAYGTYAGGPGYNIEFDVNTDGKIDIKDIHLIAAQYGKSAPVWPLP